MTSLSKKLLFIVIPALVIIMGLLGVLLFLPSGNGGVFVEQIAQARRLSESGDYQKAIVYYQKAIENDDTQEEPYIELANIYFLLNMREEALRTLREGIRKTNSVRLSQELEQHEDSGADVNSGIDKFAAAETVNFNTTYTDAFASYNFEKYTRECTIKNEQASADTYTVVYAQYDAVFEYVNSIDNPVLDASTGQPYPYARPTAIKMNDFSRVLSGVQEGVSVDVLKSCGASDISVKPFDKQLDTCLVTFEFHGLTFTVGCDEEGTIKGNDVYNQIVPKPGQGTVEEKSTVTGTIIDSTTGKKVSHVTLRFHSGKDNREGEVVATENVSGGDYSVELQPGDYTVEIVAEGYNKEYMNLYVSDNDSTPEQSISLSPTLAANEIRFVLEWGAIPNDLDSHLTGECNTGNGKIVNISWMNRRSSNGGTKIAELDLDDVDGFGPETTTLYDTNGTYEYRVHRYSRNGSLSSSGATVKIYAAGSSPIVVKVPEDITGDWWTVCRVENGQITDINGIRE